MRLAGTAGDLAQPGQWMTGEPSQADRRRRDELLAALTHGRAGEEALRELIAEHVAPLVERLVGDAVSRGTVAASDAADVVHECTLRLLSKLRGLADGDDEEPIHRLDQYVTVVVRHAIEDYRRLLDPARTRLAHRVRYVATHTRSLAVWGGDRQVCGLAEWRGRKDVATLEPQAGRVAEMTDAAGLRRLVVELVRDARGPVEMNALIDAVADAAGLVAGRDTTPATRHDIAEAPRPGLALESRQYLRQIWDEIRGLPVRQRQALLLNLRLDDGDSAARALVALGVVGVTRLAETLEVSLDRLLDWWQELPLADERIARSLGVTRQQVINLRKAARDRLARRMGRRRPRREERT